MALSFNPACCFSADLSVGRFGVALNCLHTVWLFREQSISKHCQHWETDSGVLSEIVLCGVVLFTLIDVSLVRIRRPHAGEWRAVTQHASLTVCGLEESTRWETRTALKQAFGSGNGFHRCVLLPAWTNTILKYCSDRVVWIPNKWLTMSRFKCILPLVVRNSKYNLFIKAATAIYSWWTNQLNQWSLIPKGVNLFTQSKT